MAYIRKERLLADILDKSIIHKSSNVRDFLRIFYKMVEQQTEADVEKVRHGEWIDKPTGSYNRMQSWCSACGKHSGIGGIESNRHKPYCPNCGARMDGGKNENV